jgi:hypothetical protein
LNSLCIPALGPRIWTTKLSRNRAQILTVIHSRFSVPLAEATCPKPHPSAERVALRLRLQNLRAEGRVGTAFEKLAPRQQAGLVTQQERAAGTSRSPGTCPLGANSLRRGREKRTMLEPEGQTHRTQSRPCEQDRNQSCRSGGWCSSQYRAISTRRANQTPGRLRAYARKLTRARDRAAVPPMRQCSPMDIILGTVAPSA